MSEVVYGEATVESQSSSLLEFEGDDAGSGPIMADGTPPPTFVGGAYASVRNDSNAEQAPVS